MVESKATAQFQLYDVIQSIFVYFDVSSFFICMI